MPKVIPGERWQLAADLYSKGESLAGIARAVGVSVTAVRKHRDDDGWVRELDTAEAVVQAFKPEQTQPVSELMGVLSEEIVASMAADERIAELERRLAEEQARASLLAERVEDQSSVKEVHLYENPQQVEEYYGSQRIEDMVSKEFGRLNIERLKQGLERIDPKSFPEEYAAARERILQEFVSRRTKWVDPSANVRVVKMWNPHTKTMWQCPVEDQFNNEKMFRGAAVLKYKAKGHKLLSPYMCQRMNCWAFAAVEDGVMKYRGYCSPAHMQSDLYIAESAKAGVSTSGATG